MTVLEGSPTAEALAEPPARSLLYKTGWSALAGGSTVLGRFLVTIYTARSLGPEGAGGLAYLLWILEMVATVTGFGMQSCVTRFVADLRGQARQDAARSLTRWLYVRYLGLTFLGAVGIAAVALYQQRAAADTAVWISLGICFVLQAMGTFYLAFLAGQQQFAYIARMNVISSGLLVVCAGVGTALWGVTGALAGYAAGSLLPALLSWRLLEVPRGQRRLHVKLDADLTSRCLRYALFAWCAAMVSACIWSRVEVVFLERFWGHQAVAMFSVGLTLSALAIQGPVLLGSALMPHFAESSGAAKGAADRRVYAGGTRLLAALLFPMCLGLSSIVPVLLPAMYGEAFRPAVPSAMLLTAFAALSFMNVGSALVYASGNAWFIAASGFAGAVLSLAGCAIIVPVWGAWGACLSRSVVQTAMAALGTWYVARHLGCPAPLRALAKILLASTTAALGSYAVISYVPKVQALVVDIPVAAIVYLAMLRFTRALDPSDAVSIRSALSRMPAAMSSPVSLLLGWLGL